MAEGVNDSQAVDPCAKGTKLLAEAESSLGSKQGLCCAMGSSKHPRTEAACALYAQAGNAFKVAKEWGRAGLAFEEAATLEFANSRHHESGTHYVEAAKCYKKVNTTEAAKCLLKATEIYANMNGRQKVAAKHHQALAELYEEEGKDKNLPQSIHHYSMAAEFFGSQESTSAANKCWLKVAKHSAMLDDHKQAYEIFERLATEALESHLLRYTAADLYLRAALCRLYLDVVASRTKGGELAEESFNEVLHGYETASPPFAESRELILLRALVHAAAENDLEAWNEAVRSHESISQLDDWHHELLRMLRKHVSGTADLR